MWGQEMVASYRSNPILVRSIVEVLNLLLGQLRQLVCDLMVTNIAAFETSQNKGCSFEKLEKDGMIVQFGLEKVDRAMWSR
jgi:hypothetical protein